MASGTRVEDGTRTSSKSDGSHPAGAAPPGADGDLDKEPAVKRKRLNADVDASTAAKWTNAASGVDPFNISQVAAPHSNKARDILAEIKKQMGPKTKAPEGGWGESTDFIALGADETLDFRPPAQQSLSLSGRAANGRGRGQRGPRRAGNDMSRGGGRFSHRDHLHANAGRIPDARAGLHRAVPPTARYHAPDLSSRITGPPSSATSFSIPKFEPGLSTALDSAPPFPRQGQKSTGHIDDQSHDTRLHSPQPDDNDPSNRSKEVARKTKKAQRARSKKRRADEISDDPPPTLGVVDEWEGDSIPWLPTWASQTVEDGALASPEQRLHNEIVGFHEWIRPYQFEEEMRNDVVDRLQTFMDYEIGPGECSVLTFGSFASGLYLPNADIDVVALPAMIEPGEAAGPLVARSKLIRLAKALTSYRVAKARSARAIPNAKVPIIKYTDLHTGLNVDISFSNKNGLPAVQLCRNWAQEQPALAVLVSLMKLYLVMRKSNEVFEGGIGGFSIICLVHAFLDRQTHGDPSVDPMTDLGRTFLSLLEFYGSEMDIINTGVNLRPVGFFSKKYHRLPNKERLCIVDPLDPNNDIAAGSLRSVGILRSLATVKTMLEQRMEELRKEPDSHQSILGAVYAGYYEPMEALRERLLQLNDERKRSAQR